MITHRRLHSRGGFTLMELMVAMAITVIIVTVLISITSIATDTWNRSRAQLRASRQAQAMVEVMAKDFEAMVARRGNTNEWLAAQSFSAQTRLSARSDLPLKHSTGAADMVFFTVATDRYDGNAGKTGDRAGDVSCVGYRLDWKDPIASGGSQSFETFVLNRYVVDPDLTFANLLGQEYLQTAFDGSYGTQLKEPQNFVCENVFQFSATFHVEILDENDTPVRVVLVPIGPSGGTYSRFSIKGSGIETDAAITLNSGEKLGGLSAVEISLTVLSDLGVDQLRSRFGTTAPSAVELAELLAKHSFQYSKLVRLPVM